MEDLGDVGLADVGGVLGAEAGRVDEGTFKMDAGRTAELLGLAILGDAYHRVLEHLGSECEGRREVARHALFELRLADGGNRGRIVVRNLEADGAVRMDVEEAGNDILAGGVVRPVRLGHGRSRGKDFENRIVLDNDAGAVEAVAGCDNRTIDDAAGFHGKVSL